MAETDLAIGIDLGTTNSCAAVWVNGQVKIIKNEMQQTTTSSRVTFTKNGYHVGNTSSQNDHNTIYDAKRLMGRDYTTATNLRNSLHWPFKFTKDAAENPIYNVECRDAPEMFYPEQISAMILSKLKGDCESYLGHSVKDAVITVPAYFNESQRNDTKLAALVAGLNVLKIITEPAAAALAYGRTNTIDNERNILIYDLGKSVEVKSIVYL